MVDFLKKNKMSDFVFLDPVAIFEQKWPTVCDVITHAIKPHLVW